MGCCSLLFMLEEMTRNNKPKKRVSPNAGNMQLLVKKKKHNKIKTTKNKTNETNNIPDTVT